MAVTTGTETETERRTGAMSRVSGFFYRHLWTKLLVLLLPAVLWLLVLYLGSIGGLLVYSFWRIEEFTGLIDRTLTLSTYGDLLEPANREIVLRTLAMAAAVTVVCSVLAFPLAYYMARYAGRRARFVLYLTVLMPLWSSYLVRALAWRQILTREGVLYWSLEKIGLDGVLDALITAPLVGGSSLIAFELEGGKERAFRALNRLKLIDISNNLGDAKSLITHPATTTHQRLSPEERQRLGIGAGLLRLSVGLEDPQDLIEDLAQALQA